jgi:ferredoxin/flavodoxin---NADP+ reductase
MFTCVDGPEFDGHEVDWDIMRARKRIYLEEEKISKENFEHKCRVAGA